MSDGALSQDEIDALLSGGGSSNPLDSGAEPADQPAQESAPVVDAQADAGLSESEVQSFGNLLGEVAESQGSNLSILTDKTITLGKPTVALQSKADLIGSLADEIVEIRIDFTNGIPGEHFYILPNETANMLASLMMGQAGGELDEAALSAVSEAVSQITGSLTTALGDKFGLTLVTSAPELEKAQQSDVKTPTAEPFLVARYPFSIEGESESELLELFAGSVAKQIVASYDADQGGDAAGEGVEMPQMETAMQPDGDAAPAQAGASPAPDMAGDILGEQMDLGDALTGLTGAEPAGPGPAGPEPTSPGPTSPGPAQPNVQPLQFSNLAPSQPGATADQGNISLLMDVFMEMTVELGRTKMSIKDILQIGEGTIVELDKLAGEPVDILVNHKLIAKGEVVVIDENFGVRVTEIISAGIERLGNMT